MPSPSDVQKLEQAQAIIAELKVHRDNLNTTLYRAYAAGVRVHVNAYYDRSPKVVKQPNGVELMRVDLNDIGLSFPNITGDSE